MKVFTVVMMDDFSKSLTLEHYSMLELALTRANVWCYEIYGANGNHNPSPQPCVGNTVEYMVYQSEEEDVLVCVLEQEVLETLPPFKGKDKFFTVGGDLSGATSEQLIAAILPPVDDPAEASLPAGWDYDGNPVRMDTLKLDPECVKSTKELSPAQQWALVIARVSKRPHFSWPTSFGTFVQFSALAELKNKTSIGMNIFHAELQFLDNFRSMNTVLDVGDDNDYDDAYYGSTT